MISLHEAVRVNGAIAVVAEITGVGLATARLGTDGWAILPLGDVLRRGPDAARYVFPQQVAAGPAGIAVAIYAEAPDLPVDIAPHLVDHDDYSLVAVAANGMVVIDAGGNVIGRVGARDSRFTSGALSPRADGAMDVLRDDGTVADTFTSTEIEAGWAALSASGPLTTIPSAFEPTVSTLPDVFHAPGGPSTYIAFSRDLGVTWSISPVEQLIGTPGNYLRRLMVTDDSVIVEVNLLNSTAERPLNKVLKGTL